MPVNFCIIYMVFVVTSASVKVYLVKILVHYVVMIGPWQEVRHFWNGVRDFMVSDLISDFQADFCPHSFLVYEEFL